MFRFISKNMQYFAVVGAGAIYGGSLLPSTLLIDQWKEFREYWENGYPMKVPQKIETIGKEVMDQMCLNIIEEANIQMFMFNGMDVTHKGSIYTKGGAFVGIPYNYTLKDYFQLNPREFTLVIENKALDWYSEAGITAMETLILNDKMKKFSIARELFYTQMWHVHVNALLATSMFSLSYVTGHMLNRGFRMKTRASAGVRLGFYLVISGFSLLGYLLLKDAYMCARDKKADTRAACVSREYAEGGVEYYTYLLDRNKALRELFGEEGPAHYTYYGNPVRLWRTPTMTLTQRRDELTKLIKERYDQEYRLSM